LLFPYQANRGDADELYVDKNGDLVIVEVKAGPPRAKRAMANPTKPTEAKSQPERFIKTASRLECDEDKKRFEERLKRIAKLKPERAGKRKPV
jgi:hypothetical protein